MILTPPPPDANTQAKNKTVNTSGLDGRCPNSNVIGNLFFRHQHSE